MLDTTMKSQLQAYLQNLRSPIRLIATLDASEKSAELRELLQEIAELSDKVHFDESGVDARKPSFVIAKEGETTGVCFAAIPLGHEFTSLVLALLWTGDLALPTATAGWVGFAAAPAFYLLAFVGTVTAVSALGAVRTGFFSNFESVGVIVFAALILGQYMSAMQMAGAALVITSMFIFSAPPRTPAADRPAG